jgi:CDP-diacylglycerol---serine O-phosphatidyltransferase
MITSKKKTSMPIKGWIPNLLTLGNLGCGALAIILVLDGDSGKSNTFWIAGLVVAAMLCDFLDGFVARLLGVSSPLGKELDSLADMVTFGLLPGLLVYAMLKEMVPQEMGPDLFGAMQKPMPLWQTLLIYTGLIIPLFSALRLAKFNIDTRQSDRFLGLATPANALFWLSVFLVFRLDNANDWSWHLLFWVRSPLVILALTLLSSALLVTEIPLIAFKFKTKGLAANWPKFLFLGISVVLLATLQYRAGPPILLLYFVFSMIDATRK